MQSNVWFFGSSRRVTSLPLQFLLPLIVVGCASRNPDGNSAAVKGIDATTRGEGWKIDFEGGTPEAERELDKNAIEEALKGAVKNQKSMNAKFPLRDAHPKAHGCIKGTFEVLGNLPGDFATGLFAQAETYPVWARFSNAGLVPGNIDDEIPDGRGMALKVIGFQGQKFTDVDKNDPDKSSKNFDFNLVNIPVFPTATIRQYIKLQKNPLSLLTDGGVDIAKSLAFSLAVAPKNHPFGFSYFSITPFKLGKKAVKYRAEPCTDDFATRSKRGKDDIRGKDYMKESMLEAFGNNKQACFNLKAQLFVNNDLTPMETTTEEWKEEVAPFGPVLATIRFEAADNAKFDNQKRNEFCEFLSFNPWRVTAEHEPLGRLNRVRQAVYKAVSEKRHSDPNGKPEFEPDGKETN